MANSVKLPKMPEPEPGRMLGYDAIRYVPGWPESYLREFAAAYGAACYAAGMEAAAAIVAGMTIEEAQRLRMTPREACIAAIRAAKGTPPPDERG